MNGIQPLAKREDGTLPENQGAPDLITARARPIRYPPASHDRTAATVSRGPVRNPAEYSSDVEDVVFSSWPCSMVTKSRGEAGPTALPTDVKSAWIEVLLPTIPGVDIKFADVLTDEGGTRYSVSSTEHSDLGWRLLVAESNT